MTNGNDLITPLINTDTEAGHYSGLTKREYFAAMAMQGLLASGDYTQDIAHSSVECADALISELNKQQP